MAAMGRDRLQNAVRGGVVTSGVHGVGAGLVQGRRKPHIARGPTGDGDFGHDARASLGLLQAGQSVQSYAWWLS